MIDVQKLLYEICEDKRVYDGGTDLTEEVYWIHMRS